MSYDFSTLNDKDLEELVRDILSIRFNIDFQSFKMGKDGGVDLRYATNNNENEIIVQVKHYLGSKISKLKSDLKKKEVSKVKLINPSRYIFVTSLGLTPKLKNDIKLIFDPFILSTNDVLGKDDLNNFLRSNSSVVNSHFKLWLSSTNVLTRILKNGINGRSEFIKAKIQDKIRTFVPCNSHKNSVDILNKFNFILITGTPGIGKSTLANMLTYQLLAEDFELVYIREISEAEDLFFNNKRQVFYFDDFLGSITLDLTTSKNADSAIVQFIERIKGDNSKRLILTCRTTILNQAKELSDKINNSKIEISKHEIQIENYKEIDKARILYNHVYFSNLSEDLKEVFFKNQFYWKVIRHKFYNPRVIEFFTDIERLQPGTDYSKEVINFLDDPSSIWEKSYLIQTSNSAKLFLSTLYSLGVKYAVDEETMKEAFEARLNYEMQVNHYQKQGSTFYKIVNELSGGFLIRTIKINKHVNVVEYSFLNPSLEDFFYIFFSKNISEYLNILESSIHMEQFKGRISTAENSKERKIYFTGRDYDKLLGIYLKKVAVLQSNCIVRELDVVNVSIQLFKWLDIQDIVIDLMNNVNIIHLGWADRENLINILDYFATYNLLRLFSFSIENMILKLAEDAPSHFQIESLSKLIAKHKIYSDIINENKIQHTEYFLSLQQSINKSWVSVFDYFISHTSRINDIVHKERLVEIVTNQIEEANKLNSILNIECSFIKSYTYDYESQLQKNLVNLQEKTIQIFTLDNNEDNIDETLEINRLFNSNAVTSPDISWVDF
jgi:dephospho-CoA kinase